MIQNRRLLLASIGTPLTSLIQNGLVSERIRSMLGERCAAISVHNDRAARLAVARMGSHACSLGDKVFLGGTIDTEIGPSFTEALHHELVHVAQVEFGRKTGRLS